MLCDVALSSFPMIASSSTSPASAADMSFVGLRPRTWIWPSFGPTPLWFM